MSSCHRFQISVVIHFRFIKAVGDNAPEVRDRDSSKSESFLSRTRHSAPDSSTLYLQSNQFKRKQTFSEMSPAAAPSKGLKKPKAPLSEGSPSIKYSKSLSLSDYQKC